MKECRRPAWSLRGNDPLFAERYFRRSGRSFMLAERLRERVKFQHLNLAAEAYPLAIAGSDIILCRNVLIYFDRETIGAVAQRLFDCLADGGWLLTGPSDPSLVEHAPYETVATSAGVLYRRSTPIRACPVRLPLAAAAPTPSREAPEKRYTSPVPHTELMSPAAPSLTRGPLDEAREAFARGDHARVLALTRDETACPVASELHVRALADLGDMSGAERAASDAITRHSLKPELHFLRAVLLMGLGRVEEASRAARQVIFLDRSMIVPHFTLAMILRQCGNIGGAIRAYRNGYRLASARPIDEIVALSDGQTAGQLAETARRQLIAIESLVEAAP